MAQLKTLRGCTLKTINDCDLDNLIIDCFDDCYSFAPKRSKMQIVAHSEYFFQYSGAAIPQWMIVRVYTSDNGNWSEYSFQHFDDWRDFGTVPYKVIKD